MAGCSRRSRRLHPPTATACAQSLRCTKSDDSFKRALTGTRTNVVSHATDVSIGSFTVEVQISEEVRDRTGESRQNFATVDSNNWNASYDAANDALDRLDDAIDKAE